MFSILFVPYHGSTYDYEKGEETIKEGYQLLIFYIIDAERINRMSEIAIESDYPKVCSYYLRTELLITEIVIILLVGFFSYILFCRFLVKKE